MSNVKSTIQFALVSALSLAAVSTEAQASGDEEVIITAEIKGKTCGLQWHAHAGGNSAVGAKEHIAKFDCGTTEGDPLFLESGTEKIYTLKQGNKCYLEWAGEKKSVHGIWAEERIAKFDCGGGGDTFQIHGNRGADQFVTTKTSTQTCHFQWVGSSGGAGVGNNEYIAKWDCEAGKSGDPIRIIAKNPVTPTYTLIKSDVECKSRDVSLGSQNTLQECADACEADSDCDYFVYGKGSKYGGCYQEKTSSSACSEGWETDKYDFYALVGKPGSTPQPQSPPTPAASPTPAGHPMCGAGTTLVDGVCTVSPKDCPDKTEYNHITNQCESLIKGVCAMEAEDGTYHDPKVGPWTGYCVLPQGNSYSYLEHGGTDCGMPHSVHNPKGADSEVSYACDRVRGMWLKYLKNDPTTSARTMCADTYRWWKNGESNHAIIQPRLPLQPFWDDCAMLNNAGIRTIRRFGARSNSQ